jgi:hypothetical protein
MRLNAPCLCLFFVGIFLNHTIQTNADAQIHVRTNMPTNTRMYVALLLLWASLEDWADKAHPRGEIDKVTTNTSMQTVLSSPIFKKWCWLNPEMNSENCEHRCWLRTRMLAGRIRSAQGELINAQFAGTKITKKLAGIALANNARDRGERFGGSQRLGCARIRFHSARERWGPDRYRHHRQWQTGSDGAAEPSVVDGWAPAAS